MHSPDVTLSWSRNAWCYILSCFIQNLTILSNLLEIYYQSKLNLLLLKKKLSNEETINGFWHKQSWNTKSTFWVWCCSFYIRSGNLFINQGKFSLNRNRLSFKPTSPTFLNVNGVNIAGRKWMLISLGNKILVTSLIFTPLGSLQFYRWVSWKSFLRENKRWRL